MSPLARNAPPRSVYFRPERSPRFFNLSKASLAGVLRPGRPRLAPLKGCRQALFAPACVQSCLSVWLVSTDRLSSSP